MNKQHIIGFGAAFLLMLFVSGCSQAPVAQKHSAVVPSAVSDSGTTPAQIDQIQRDFGVVVKIRGDNIIVGTPGLKTKEEMSQIEDALHKAFGNDFTNHTIVHIVK